MGRARCRLLWILAAGLLMAGCGEDGRSGENAGGESVASAPAVPTGEPAPVYTPEEDERAAAYLRERYGLQVGAILGEAAGDLAGTEEAMPGAEGTMPGAEGTMPGAEGVLPGTEGARPGTAESVPKVILDCDMTFLGDDAMCMCILARADSLGLIELLGVTVTGGNCFVAEGTNAALRQLELIGRPDIPVYMGTDVPLNGFRDLEEQEKIVGKISRWGAMFRLESYVEPEKYHDLGEFFQRKWGYSETEPQEQSSVEFMLEQVRRYPGEVTILSVGAATNIARACLEEEAFARETAGIIYMGTVPDGEGSYTPYADFNCFYDAEAFEVCVNSAFPAQVVAPGDVAGQAALNKAVFDLMAAKNATAVSKLWLEERYSLYRRDENRRESCADAVAAVAFLNENTVLESEELWMTVNADPADPRYGAVAVSEEADGAAREDGAKVGRAVFIRKLDTELYWDFVTDLLCHVEF